MTLWGRYIQVNDDWIVKNIYQFTVDFCFSYSDYNRLFVFKPSAEYNEVHMLIFRLT